MAVNNEKLATNLIVAVGGKENVSIVVHCATRLRFTLKDKSKADAEKVKRIEGVIAVVERGGQFQVVIGNTVPDVYSEVIKAGGFELRSDGEGESGGGSKESLLNRFIDVLAGIFPPILGAMCGGGLIRGLLAICNLFGWLTPDMGTYIVLNAIGDSTFYFLPVLLGFSAGRKFGGNSYLTALIGGTLIYPSIIELAGGLGGGEITFLRIPMVLMNYTSSVIPILFAAYLCCKLEKFLRSKLHSSIKNFITPMLCMVIVVPITLFIIGPVSLGFANILAQGYLLLPAVVGGILVGALWQVLVIFGMHWGFIPLMINNMATMQLDTLGPAAQSAAMSQTGAALGMSLKMKNKAIKGQTFSTVISGIFGITEPIIYGVTLPRKKPFIMGVIGGACGGAVSGIIGGEAYSMGALGILGLPSSIHPTEGIGAGFWGALVGLLVAFVVSAVLTFITYKDDTLVEEQNESNKTETSVNSNVSTGKNAVTKTVCSPMNGEVFSLSKSKDPIHAKETIGKGVIIIPSDGKVFAPFDGTVSIVYNTLHAMGLLSNDGVELLIHVGMDTVKLDGKYFTAHVKNGDKISAGQLLLEFDIDNLYKEGYELESPIIITNTSDYQQVKQIANGKVTNGETLLEVVTGGI
jgi:PTS system, beta-glucoside-specific IIABC component